ncbi:DUF317 domain-containing protein [Streptomyces sp. NPDC047061]|uniref:DUF317 domain-containing protein n=1 Tax=Streptomyces sp. NPDC047061 TaxID=3154605 RepID=UPI0033EAD416
MPGYPHVLLESPDQRLHLALEPTAPEPRESWRRIHPAERREWSAQFGGHTPVEIIAEFTDAVTGRAPIPPWATVAAGGRPGLGPSIAEAPRPMRCRPTRPP